MKNILLIAGGMLALTACTSDKVCGDSGDACESAADSGSDDSGTDCPVYTGDTYIGFDDSLCDTPDAEAGTLAIGYNCDETNWWYDVYTVGWTGGGEIYAYQNTASPWDEGHDIGSYAFADGGHWDNLYLILDRVSDPGDVVSNSTTLYQCNSDREATLTWHLIVFETDGSTEADCAVWGAEPSELNTGCTDWS